MPPARTLVLLHGLARTRRSLWPVGWAAERRGYRVVGIDYPSRHHPLERLAAVVAERITADVPEDAFDVVSHSMGGIVLRAAVAGGHLPAARVRRAVMLAPPNGGSELAEQLRAWSPFGWSPFGRALGPAAMQLGTGEHSVPVMLPPVPFACGVIAGSRSVNPLAPRLFGGPTDGRVSVERARVEGMADFLVVARTHSLMMWAPDVLAATFAFLEHGAFGPPGRPSGTAIESRVDPAPARSSP